MISHIFLVFDVYDIFEDTGQVLCRMAIYWNFSDALSYVRLRVCDLGINTMEINFHLMLPKIDIINMT